MRAQATRFTIKQAAARGRVSRGDRLRGHRERVRFCFCGRGQGHALRARAGAAGEAGCGAGATCTKAGTATEGVGGAGAAPEPPIIQKAPGPAWGAVGRAPGADRAPPPEPPPARAPPAMAPPPARAAPGPPAPVGPPGAGRPAPVGAPGAPPAPARAPGAAWGAVGPPPPPRRPEPDPRIAPPAWGAPEPPPAWGSNGPPPPPPQQSKAPGFDRAIGGGNAFASAWEPGRLVQTPRSPPRDLAPPGLPRSPISPPLQPRASPMSSPLGAPPPGLHGDDYIPPNLVDVPRPSDAIPEGLVDVQRRSNCALDAIVAVLCRCPTFVRAAGRPSQGDSRALRALDASLQAAERGANSDAAVDALREALASSGDDTVIRAELKTRGAHLDVAEVLGEVVNVARPSAQQALRTRGRVSQQACRRCGHFNDDFVDDVELNELARSAPAAALVHAAETNGSLERVYLEAHAHAPKTCDKCRAPQACDVDVLLEQSARALVLSVGWPSSNVSSDDVLALLASSGAPARATAGARAPSGRTASSPPRGITRGPSTCWPSSSSRTRTTRRSCGRPTAPTRGRTTTGRRASTSAPGRTWSALRDGDVADAAVPPRLR